jgi:1,4-dihydroxy-2-naphthoyl-CoA hydrolase
MPDPHCIWFSRPAVPEVNERIAGTMVTHLGIRVVEVGADFMKASMPVNDTTRQSYGMLHGGASLALAESIGSIAGAYCVDPDASYCVGLDMNANHIRPVTEGTVFATARPHHVGRTTQVWEIKILDERDRLVCVGRLTLAVLPRK